MSNTITNLPVPAPEHCPGTESSEAGNASACQGKSNVKCINIGPIPRTLGKQNLLFTQSQINISMLYF